MTTEPGEVEPAKLDNIASPQQPGRVPADTFANRLVLARRLDSLTIREAAAKCGLHYATWSTWEGGRRPVDVLDAVQRISEALDIDRDWLLFGGPLLPARGRPTKRPKADTEWYSHRYVQPTGTRPNDGPQNGHATRQSGRRNRVIVRGELPGGGNARIPTYPHTRSDRMIAA